MSCWSGICLIHSKWAYRCAASYDFRQWTLPNSASEEIFSLIIVMFKLLFTIFSELFLAVLSELYVLDCIEQFGYQLSKFIQRAQTSLWNAIGAARVVTRSKLVVYRKTTKFKWSVSTRHGRRSVGGQVEMPPPTFWSGVDALCFVPLPLLIWE